MSKKLMAWIDRKLLEYAIRRLRINRFMRGNAYPGAPDMHFPIKK